MIVPLNGPHEFVFLEDTIDVAIFCAWGQDWLAGTATYLCEN